MVTSVLRFMNFYAPVMITDKTNLTPLKIGSHQTSPKIIFRQKIRLLDEAKSSGLTTLREVVLVLRCYQHPRCHVKDAKMNISSRTAVLLNLLAAAALVMTLSSKYHWF